MNLNNLNMFELISTSNLWSSKIAIVMVLSNLICIVIGRYAIRVKGLGPSIPISSLEGLGLPELLATTSLGHIIGAGAILGLKSINYLP